MAKALAVSSSSNKSPSVSAAETEKVRKAPGAKSAKKPLEGPRSDNDNINVDPVKVDVL